MSPVLQASFRLRYVLIPLTGLVCCSDCGRLNRNADAHELQPITIVSNGQGIGQLSSNDKCEG
jgi:hypothetical protein